MTNAVCPSQAEVDAMHASWERLPEPRPSWNDWQTYCGQNHPVSVERIMSQPADVIMTAVRGAVTHTNY